MYDFGWCLGDEQKKGEMRLGERGRTGEAAGGRVGDALKGLVNY